MNGKFGDMNSQKFAADNSIPEEEGVYVISVASQLSGLHPQTLRQYDRLGIVSPNRTVGKNRRYSLLDIVKLRNVQRLVGEGINLAGIVTGKQIGRASCRERVYGLV